MPPALGPARALPKRAVLLALVTLVAGDAIAESPEQLVARGDLAWERRAEGSRGRQADAGPIGAAVAAYRSALEAAPESIATRERLLKALYFQGMFAAADGPARRDIYAQARDLAEEGLARLAAELGRAQPFDLRSPEKTAAALSDRPESAALFFWAAAHWGLWAEVGGAFAAARQGVAGKIRDYAAIVVLIDERYEAAGGHRILGRLHTEAPRIPFITRWIDRDDAVASLERALELSPHDPWNRLYLADALLRFRPHRRAEAETLLESLGADLPRADFLLQDLRVLADAQQIEARVAGGD